MFRGIEHINLKMKLPQILDLKLNSEKKKRKWEKKKKIKGKQIMGRKPRFWPT
jgi:hypothetical protein